MNDTVRLYLDETNFANFHAQLDSPDFQHRIRLLETKARFALLAKLDAIATERATDPEPDAAPDHSVHFYWFSRECERNQREVKCRTLLSGLNRAT